MSVEAGCGHQPGSRAENLSEINKRKNHISVPSKPSPNAVLIMLLGHRTGGCVVSRYIPENLADIDQATMNIEGAIRDVLRRDARFPHQHRAEDADAGRGVKDQDALVLRVANASTEEIDRLIFELQSVRDMLRREGERVNRDLASSKMSRSISSVDALATRRTSASWSLTPRPASASSARC